MQDLDVAD
jgi:hypothetical protein